MQHRVRRAVAIRHVHFEDLGCFAEVLGEAGYGTELIDAGMGDFEERVAAARRADLVFVLGGPIGAHDDDAYPFLRAELALIERRLAEDRRLVGICLGAQLIARALGARVAPMPGGAKEIGWAPVMLTAAGRDGPLRHLDGGLPVLHWHGDSFELPRGAERLAATNLCPNQAFAVGRRVLGLQFHPEARAAGFARWLIGHAAELAQAGLSPVTLREGTAAHAPAAEAAGQRLLRDWLAGLGEV